MISVCISDCIEVATDINICYNMVGALILLVAEVKMRIIPCLPSKNKRPTSVKLLLLGLVLVSFILLICCRLI